MPDFLKNLFGDAANKKMQDIENYLKGTFIFQAVLVVFAFVFLLFLRRK